MQNKQTNVSLVIEHKSKTASIDLVFVPPSPVTDKTKIEVRGAVINNSNEPMMFDVGFYVDEQVDTNLLHSETISVAAKSNATVCFRWSTNGSAGCHRILFIAANKTEKVRTSRTIEILESDVPSSGRISGAWAGLLHWDDKEGKLWNNEIKLFTDEDWTQMVRQMHDIKMDIIVIQELFRNQMYYGKHNIERDGYAGKAFYPSHLYPGRMPIRSKNPVEVILSEADRNHMNVFLPIGLYAWFDFSKGSLEWHKKVADEIYQLYGHHKSFYGWYVSEEVFGDLGNNAKYWEEITEFFSEFQAHCRRLAPCKPIMLAPNCHFVPRAVDTWRKMLQHCDIICPFGFHRMPRGDISGKEAAELMQRLCDESGSHLWLDMEVFLFDKDNALFPRPINEIADDLHRYTNFETILCYQFPGLMNAQWASRKPGGEATVKLYTDYYQFVFGKSASEQPVENINKMKNRILEYEKL